MNLEKSALRGQRLESSEPIGRSAVWCAAKNAEHDVGKVRSRSEDRPLGDESMKCLRMALQPAWVLAMLILPMLVKRQTRWAEAVTGAAVK